MRTTTNVPARIHSANRKTLEETLRYRRARGQKGTHPLMAFRAQTTCIKNLKTIILITYIKIYESKK